MGAYLVMRDDEGNLNSEGLKMTGPQGRLVGRADEEEPVGKNVVESQDAQVTKCLLHSTHGPVDVVVVAPHLVAPGESVFWPPEHTRSLQCSLPSHLLLFFPVSPSLCLLSA